MVTEIEKLQNEVRDLKMIMVEQARKVKKATDETDRWVDNGHRSAGLGKATYAGLVSAYKVLMEGAK